MMTHDVMFEGDDIFERVWHLINEGQINEAIDVAIGVDEVEKYVLLERLASLHTHLDKLPFLLALGHKRLDPTDFQRAYDIANSDGHTYDGQLARNLAQVHDSALARDRALALADSFAKSRSLTHDITNDLTLARDLDRAITSVRALAKSLANVRALAKSLANVRDLDRDLDRAITSALALADSFVTDVSQAVDIADSLVRDVAYDHTLAHDVTNIRDIRYTYNRAEDIASNLNNASNSLPAISQLISYRLQKALNRIPNLSLSDLLGAALDARTEEKDTLLDTIIGVLYRMLEGHLIELRFTDVELTPYNLQTKTLPFVQAIFNIQNIFNEIETGHKMELLEVPKPEIVLIHSGSIGFTLEGVGDAIRAIFDNVVRWKQQLKKGDTENRKASLEADKTELEVKQFQKQVEIEVDPTITEKERELKLVQLDSQIVAEQQAIRIRELEIQKLEREAFKEKYAIIKVVAMDLLHTRFPDMDEDERLEYLPKMMVEARNIVESGEIPLLGSTPRPTFMPK